MGDDLKLLKEKGHVVNERVEESPAQIDKLEEIFRNLGSTFPSVKTIEKTPTSKNWKSKHVSKNKGAASSSNNEDLKMISVHPDFAELIKKPTCKSEFFIFIPRSMIIENMHARSLRNYGCVIEEWETEEDNTWIYALCLARGVKQ